MTAQQSDPTRTADSFAPAPPPVAGPAGPSWPQRNWPLPAAAPRWPVVAGVAAAALVTFLTYLGQPAGAQVVVVVGLTAAAVTLAVTRRQTLTTPSTVILGVTTLALGAVPAVRDAPWLVALCLTAAIGTGTLLAVQGHTWSSGVLAMPALFVATIRAVPWTGAAVAAGRRAGRGTGVVRGVAIGLVMLWALAALLAAADPVVDRIVGSVLPDISFGSIMARLTVGGLVAITVAGAAFASSSPPRWERLHIVAGRGPVAEWAVPLAVVAVVLVGFAAVQIVAVADPGAGLEGTGLTPAQRARQGFGQLVAVTVLAVALLAWTGRRADPTQIVQRRLMAGLGGVVTLGVLAVVTTALQRMWFYEQVFGWTVMRLLVAVFEGWLGILLVLVAVTWSVKRLDVLPRCAVASAALTLVALAAVNPEGWIAERNVDRYQQGWAVDTAYLAGLSDDAVPAIAVLPSGLRTCALGTRVATEASWYATNWSRHRSRPVLLDHEIPGRDDLSCPASTGAGR